MTITTDDGQSFGDQYDWHVDRQTQVAENTQRQQYDNVVTDTLKSRGASDSIIAAFRYHIGHESGWNPNLREPDQPHYGGEAHFAHGFLSEGGPETQPMYEYARKHNTSWNDPATQINFAVDNLQKSGLWNKMAGESKEDAASTMLTGYLRPAERYQQQRLSAIRGGMMDKDPMGTQGSTGEMPYINPQTGRYHINVSNRKDQPDVTGGGGSYPSYQDAVIDHNHDVPLIAGGLMNSQGDVIGSTFSRLLPQYANIEGNTIDMFEGVHLHEMAEIKEMEENLLPSGMPSNMAYKQAHDNVATPAEQEWARGKAKSLGVDPEKFWQSYQNHWKEMAKITENVKPEKVHPDLYLHPYHGHKYQEDVEKLSGRTIDKHPGARIREAGLLSDMYNWATGHKGEAEAGIPPKVNLAEPMSHYPGEAEVSQAEKAGHYYGTGNEAFEQGEVANVYGHYGNIGNNFKGKDFHPDTAEGHTVTGATNMPSERVKLTGNWQKQVQEKIKEAEIAVRRSPIAALGFDPRQINFDMLNQKRLGLAGAYLPGEYRQGSGNPFMKDRTYMDPRTVGTITHEATHRGLQILARESPEAAEIMKKYPSGSTGNELIVRALMATKGGDPEHEGNLDEEQRQEGVDAYNVKGSNFRNDVDRLEEIAQELQKKKHPAGGHQ